MGQPLEANVRVEELIRTVQGVAELMATHTVDRPVLPPNNNRTSTGYSPPDYPPPSLSESTGDGSRVLDQIAIPSRKRRASPIGPDHITKAPRLEPLDDLPLHLIQSSIGVAPFHPLPTISSTIYPTTSLPPPQPILRPHSAGSSELLPQIQPLPAPTFTWANTKEPFPGFPQHLHVHSGNSSTSDRTTPTPTIVSAALLP